MKTCRIHIYLAKIYDTFAESIHSFSLNASGYRTPKDKIRIHIPHVCGYWSSLPLRVHFCSSVKGLAPASVLRQHASS
jgi:hypothetical protein